MRSCPPLERIVAVSDVHTDHASNFAWCEALAASPSCSSSVLLLAGDVSEKLARFEETLALLSGAFGAVFFVPGNHDLWCRKDGSEGADSVAKLERLERVCESHGVLTTPQRVSVGGSQVAVVPLLSFYHASFDTEPDVTRLRLPSARASVSDYKATRWPEPLECGGEPLAEWFDALNDGRAGRAAAQAAGRADLTPLGEDSAGEEATAVVSFSHFVPRIELVPEKRYLVYPPLMQAVGSRPLGRRVAALRPDLHVFGHTHFGWDGRIDGVRYVQAALATPRERERRPRSLAVGDDFRPDGGRLAPLCVFDAAVGGLPAPRRAAWSEHYLRAPRAPSDTRPAPWVVDHWLRRAPARVSSAEGEEAADGVGDRGPWGGLVGPKGPSPAG